MVGAAAEGVTGYQRAFRGQADQLSLVRHDIARHLAGCPAADDVVLIASELAANSCTRGAGVRSSPSAWRCTLTMR